MVVLLMSETGFIEPDVIFVLSILIYKMHTTREAEHSSKARSPAPMRTFKESEKSQKTVRSMIEVKGGDKGKEQSSKKNKNTKKEGKSCCYQATGGMFLDFSPSESPPDVSTSPTPAAEPVKADQGKSSSSVQKMVENGNQGLTQDEIMQKKREEFFKKRMGGTTEKARQDHL